MVFALSADTTGMLAAASVTRMPVVSTVWIGTNAPTQPESKKGAKAISDKALIICIFGMVIGQKISWLRRGEARLIRRNEHADCKCPMADERAFVG